MEVENVQELMDMLTGDGLPDGIVMNRTPNLDPDVAFSIIWFLQEHMRILPGNYEKCCVCHLIFDSHSEGYIIDGTAEPDDWHIEQGVTQEMLIKNDGAKFCQPTCEWRFWRNITSAANDQVTPCPTCGGKGYVERSEQALAPIACDKCEF